MKTVNTVLGQIPVEELGRTLIHEHVICTSPVIYSTFGEKWFPREKIVELAVLKLKNAAEKFNLKTMVDATPLNLGRDLALLAEVSRKSGVNIIASTGMYYMDDFSMKANQPEILAEYFIEESVSGEEKTGIRPGFLKCAADADGITLTVKNVHEMIGLVQKQTGLPVFAHSSAGKETGLEQLELLESKGADPSKIIIGHCADSGNPEYAEKLLKRGCCISIDRLYHSDQRIERKINIISTLAERGWLGKIFLSHDDILCHDTNNCKNRALPDEHRKKTHHDDPFGLCVIHDLVFPVLRKRGFGEAELNQLLIANPQGLFR